MPMPNIKKIIRKIRASTIPAVPSASPTRLAVSLTKWKNNAQSPVMLMIDDLTNAWVKGNKPSSSITRGDWGGLYDQPDSIFSFLDNNLYALFPEIRTTFFTVVGTISQYTHHQPFTYAKPINHDQASIRFFNKLFTDHRFEIAYHGFNHGIPGKTTQDFIQEWKHFPSLQAAIDQTREGMEIYYDVFGVMPAGGKYGGWEYNQYADKSIDQSGFHWWCRDWMPRDVTGAIRSDYYEPQVFGDNKVIALPATVHGNHWSKRQLDSLLTAQQVIAIEEHIGALRPDGLIQTPNVYDDIKRLQALFNYLSDKNVWHATGSQIADYADAYNNTVISDIGMNSFRLNYSGRRKDNEISLIIQFSDNLHDCSSEPVLIGPDASVNHGKKILTGNFTFQFNIKTVTGEYKLKRD